MFLTMAEKKSNHIFNLYLKIVRPKHIAGVTTNDNKKFRKVGIWSTITSVYRIRATERAIYATVSNSVK